jgi:hypothetical protein
VLTRSTYFFAKKNSLLAVFFLIFGTSLFSMPTAKAESAWTTVICGSNAGNQQSFQIGWDNSNQFFADKGYIPRLYCEGGYAGNYRTYISDTLNGGPLGYFQGIVPVVVEPTPVVPSDTSTATVDTGTAQTDTETATVDTSTSQTDTSTSNSDTTTTTSQQETPTVTPQPTDSSTVPSDTSTVETPTVAPVDGSTATSQPAPEPAPIPAPPPAVEPVPEPQPVTEPEVEPVPEPIAQPEIPIEEELPLPVEEVVAPVDVTPEPPVVEEEEIIAEVIQADQVDLSTLDPETPVQLENGVVLEAGVVVALQLLENPAELLGAIFTNPAEALTALSNIGADMAPEVREKSEKVVISAVIAGNIATQAAASAAAVASYRRKP